MKLLFNGFRHGHINALYAKAMADERVCVVGCIEENAEAKSAARAKLKVEFSDKSYDEWLASDIDAVAIGMAFGDRGKAIIKALKAKKHVIADKPVCTSLAELEEIRRLAKENGLTVACMLDLRYLPQALKAKEILNSCILGEVKNVAFNGQHYLDYAHRPSWYFEDGKHGGTINDLAIHGIDLVRMLTGLEFAKTDAARVWNSYAFKTKNFKDAALFMARLENGAGVLADVSYSAPSQAFKMPSYWEFRFWCEKGMLSFNYVDNKVTLYKEGETQAEVFEGVTDCGDYLDEFINGTSDTENVLNSTETALLIQKDADKNP